MEEIKYTWNYECLRDFAGSFYGKTNARNTKLMYVLPEAVNKYAKELAEENGTSFEDERNEIVSMIDYHDEDMIDYRTGIDCKKVIIDCLLHSKQPSDEELAAILDVIYIDSISAHLEKCAIDTINSSYIRSSMLAMVTE